MSNMIRLRADTFSRAARLAGYRSDYALAKAMSVSRSTLSRVLNGTLRPGNVFIGGALVALAPMSFDDLFEVVREKQGAGDVVPPGQP
ncbi:transcriptional regulator [Saccharothrix longispora]|uniref:transcriptional regulator n=1 Tax=Saccharothrix longispora TaxID=33920 RepID=UPI0028FDA4DE|nr:transcriptional regulator [Saccharothrix longispora]MDU0289214.1 transcriptional regulator [Saccharothrix longispora]